MREIDHHFFGILPDFGIAPKEIFHGGISQAYAALFLRKDHTPPTVFDEIKIPSVLWEVYLIHRLRASVYCTPRFGIEKHR